MTKYLSLSLLLLLALASNAWAEGRTIVVVNGDREVRFGLNDTPAAASLWEQLPFTVSVEDYGSNEKIFYPPEELDAANGKEGDCPAGTLALFSPWGNVVMFYGPAPRYPGLYILGHATSGAEEIQGLSGTIEIRRAEEAPAKGEETPSGDPLTQGDASSGGGCDSLRGFSAPLSLLLSKRVAGSARAMSRAAEAPRMS